LELKTKLGKFRVPREFTEDVSDVIAYTERIMRSRTLRNVDFNIKSPQTAVYRDDKFVVY